MRESSAGKKLLLQLDKLCLQYDETKGKVFPAFSILLPQWQRGQQSWVLQRNSVPSGQEGVSITGQLTFSVVMNTSSFILTHRCNTHLSCGDCHTSPTYKQR